jgi:hypothetical protein
MWVHSGGTLSPKGGDSPTFTLLAVGSIHSLTRQALEGEVR